MHQGSDCSTSPQGLLLSRRFDSSHQGVWSGIYLIRIRIHSPLFFLSAAAPGACGSSWAGGQIRVAAAGLRHSSRNAGSLTRRARPEIEPASSRTLCQVLNLLSHDRNFVIYISLLSNCWAFFHVFTGYLYIFWGKMSFRWFAHFFKWAIYLFIEFKILYIF